MENLKIIYIDDYPETSLSKYLDKYKNSSCNVESLDIKFNPDILVIILRNLSWNLLKHIMGNVHIVELQLI